MAESFQSGFLRSPANTAKIALEHTYKAVIMEIKSRAATLTAVALMRDLEAFIRQEKVWQKMAKNSLDLLLHKAQSTPSLTC